MKTSNRFLLLFAMLFFAAACNEDKDPYAPVGGETLAVAASAGEVVLTPETNSQTAVTFTWNKGPEYADNVGVTYCFKMDIADNAYATATPLEVLGKDVFSRSFTVEELNDLCLEHWGVTPGETVCLEAKVIARLTADKFLMPSVATTAFEVKTYKLPSVPLYILGDAVVRDGAPLGWDPVDAIRMTEEVLSRQYSCKATFRAGEYLFPLQQTAITPAYGKGGSSSVLKRFDDGAPVKFTIVKPATYKIIVNLKKLTQTLIYYPVYEHIYMVGDATPGEWNIDNAAELKWVEGTAKFVYEGPMKAGSVKFPAGHRAWDAPFYMATVNDQSDLGNMRMQFVEPGGVDYKWLIRDAGNYRITLDIDELRIEFKRL